jgi:adenosylmethionine-8-amino-7-oxononanoate aminotransferase
MMRTMPKVPAPFTYRVPDGHDPEGFAAYAAECLEQEILAQGPETVLAFIMEPIGGLATGALVAPDVYYTAVRHICDRYGVLLIFDEVMSGAGRSGRFLAAHHWPDAKPDLAVLAKGIGAGYTPLGIMLASAEMVEQVVASGGFQHGHTYNANPLTCAVGRAVLQRTRDLGLIDNAARMGALLKARLEDLMARSPIVGDVRGRGLLLALELVADKETKALIPPEYGTLPRLARLAMDRGLALYTRMTNGGRYGQWLMLTPPLIVTAEQIDEIMAILEEVLGFYAAEMAAEGLLRR